MDAAEIRYALAKQLATAHTLASNYGDVPLDDELREVIDTAVRPVLECRLAQLAAERSGHA